jgi:hypothetical protein
MKLNTYQQKILEWAVEDAYGLWEILWGLQGKFPNRTKTELRQVAESEVRELLRKGWISVSRRSGATDEDTPLQRDEAEAALGEEKNWDEPATAAIQVVVGATATGEHIYYEDQLGVSTEQEGS